MSKGKERSKLENFMRKVGDLCNVNFRFHKTKSNPRGRDSSFRHWVFEWWIRIPGNPLNKRHVLEYNYGWPVSSFQPCKHRIKYVEQHPGIDHCCEWPDDGKLEHSEVHEYDLSGLDSGASKDEAVEHVLFHTSFLKDALGHSASTYEQLMCELELHGISYESSV